ncbi:serine/threonine-protein kinase ATM-like isoform X4 [Camellia sinensis]|uniref:serine/threonine-protein kinase ATM-like isoform X4 n=1 Tax=Camellia sinensis TaxID=4442 RepID=UPI0010368C5D|nr:serine/threonine-protein kinase ATM-like isoform X4 [Camellia sinensis]
MKQMVEIYIKLAELETKRKDTNKKVTLPREIRSVQQLDLVPSYIGSYCNRMLLNDRPSFRGHNTMAYGHEALAGG